LTRRAIVSAAAIGIALQACATKAPPRLAQPQRAGAAGHARLAVLPPDPFLFPDVALALGDRLARAQVGGSGPAVSAQVSMEVAQLSLECVSPTDVCYTQVGRFLQADQLLWGQVSRSVELPDGVKVTVVLLDVDRGLSLAHAERTFAEREAAIRGLGELVDRATHLPGAPPPMGGPSRAPSPPPASPARTAPPANLHAEQMP
jgi:hypothetical protein